MNQEFPIRILWISEGLEAAQLLQESGLLSYEVYQTATVEEGLRSIRIQPDVILLEASGETRDNEKYLIQIKSAYPSIPVIIISRSKELPTSQGWIRRGAYDSLCMQNDEDKRALARAVRYAAENRRVRQALDYRFEFEKLIATISTHFIRLTIDQVDECISDSFQRIAEFAQVDRGYIFWYSDILGRHMEKIHEWCAEGVPSEMTRVRSLNMAMFPYFDGKIKNLEPFYAHRVADLPPEAASEKREFQLQSVKSLIFVPMIYAGEAIGFIGFETIRKETVWSDDVISLLKLVSQIIVNALERKRSEKTLRQSEERYALVARGVNDGLWDWDLKTNKIFFSTRWKSMLGYTEEEISEDPQEWFLRVHPDDFEQVNSKVKGHLDGDSSHYESEHRMLHKDGTYRWMLTRGMAVKDSKNRVTRMAGSQTDITDRKKAEEQLMHHALHDTLTGLANRALFVDRLKFAVERSKLEKDYAFAVLFIDLDNFKSVNDSFGHQTGDQFILEVAKRLSSCVAATDTVARFGGDEFVLLLDNIRKASLAVRVAERIQNVLYHPILVGGQNVMTTASIGIALSSPESDADELLRNADTAMYRAKNHHRGSHVVFDDSMHEKAVELLKLETELRKATDAYNFHLNYQPIVNLASQEIIGFEALIRWNHPERGLVAPGNFIPLAEENGLIIPIGWWVLREACKEIRSWQSRNPFKKALSVSVNISMKQITLPDFVSQIQDILAETGMDPALLHLEITESIFIENNDQAVSVLNQLRALGIQLHLDDFGTGYSSLSYLNRFHFNVIKIDRSFIHNIESRGKNEEIVRAIISLAHNMGMKVVAEGIETPEQLEILTRLGCEYGQGYLFSRPLASEDAAALAGRS